MWLVCASLFVVCGQALGDALQENIFVSWIDATIWKDWKGSSLIFPSRVRRYIVSISFFMFL